VLLSDYLALFLDIVIGHSNPEFWRKKEAMTLRDYRGRNVRELRSLGLMVSRDVLVMPVMNIQDKTRQDRQGND
jgi:hypothetical protein